jgi:predicted lactoylglutathione lyase
MKTELNALTLPINNLNKLKKFYSEVFGWRLVTENDYIAMFRLNTTVLTLCSESIFSSYSKLVNYNKKKRGSALTLVLPTPEAVDKAFSEMQSAGVKIVKLPTSSAGGYSGLITDPENNQWEICYHEAA